MPGIIKKQFSGDCSSWPMTITGTQLALNTRIIPIHNTTPYAAMFARLVSTIRENYVTTVNPLNAAYTIADRLHL
jgi:hypothetical protein